MCCRSYAIRHIRLNSSKQRMESGKVQDMNRRGKGDGGNKRSVGDKSKWRREKRKKLRTLFMSCHHAYTVLFETIFHILAARLPDHPAEYVNPQTSTRRTTKVQFPEPWTLFEIPGDGQVQRTNVRENKKFHCLCEKVGVVCSNADRQWLYLEMTKGTLSSNVESGCI